MAGTKTILGFITGLSIGAIAGILLAPEKGSDTRQMIADRTSQLGNSLKASLNDFIKGKSPLKEEEEIWRQDVPKMNLNTMG